MRLKAVEMATNDGNWTRASHLELVPKLGASLTSTAEEEAIRKEVLLMNKLENSISSEKGWKGYGKGKYQQPVYLSPSLISNRFKKGKSLEPRFSWQVCGGYPKG